MRRFTFLTATLVVNSTSGLAAQATQAPVTVRATTVVSFPNVSEDLMARDIVGSPGGKFIYYVTAGDVRVYDRAKQTTSVMLQGEYTYVVSSPAGDRLALLRPAEGSTAGPLRQLFIWTMPVNPESGAAAGEARRVSLLPADAPRFSPDGSQIAFIATGMPRKMMVMPSNGGVERILFERGGPQAPVRWSPDGKWIYFTQPSRAAEAPYVVSRVSVDSGAPTPVTPPVQGAFPGLTPDGRYVVALTQTAGTGFTFGIFDLDKRLVGSTKMTSDPLGEPFSFAWSGDGMHMLVSVATGDQTLRARSVSSGVDRIVPTGGRFPRTPTLSPNGRYIALAITGDSALWELAVMNADGSGRRILTSLEMSDLADVVWSPNSQFILYTRDRFRSLWVADVTTGRSTKVGSAPLNLRDFRFRPDSRAIRYIREDGTPTKTTITVWESTLDGAERLLRDMTPHLPETGETHYGATWLLGDSALFAFRQGYVMPIVNGEARRLYEPARQPTTASMNGRWIGRLATDRKSIQILSSDGQVSNTVQVPAGAAVDRLPNVQPNSDGFIVTTASTATAPPSLLLVPFDGSIPRTLLTLKAGETFNDVSISPDGATVLTSHLGPPTMLFVDVDLGTGLRAPARRE